MKWLLIISFAVLGVTTSYAEVAIEDIGLTDISAVENYQPTEFSQELQETQMTLNLSDQNENTSLIPKQPAVEVVAEPIAMEGGFTEDPTSEIVMTEQIEEIATEFNVNSEKWYVSGIFGTTDYDKANLSTENAIGFAVGTRTFKKFIVEGSFILSKVFSKQRANANNEATRDYAEKIDQMNVGVAVKVPLFEGQVFNGLITPVAGVIASYTRRNAKEQSINGVLQNRRNGSTNALDIGLTTGVDYNATKNFALGFEYKYFFNVTSNSGENSSYASNRNKLERSDPIEKIGYHQLSLNAKFKF